MSKIETIKIAKDGQVVTINACDLDSWKANGWKNNAEVDVAIDSPKPERAESPKRGKSKAV